MRDEARMPPQDPGGRQHITLRLLEPASREPAGRHGGGRGIADEDEVRGSHHLHLALRIGGSCSRSKVCSVLRTMSASRDYVTLSAWTSHRS
jgi:hypothetical protein